VRRHARRRVRIGRALALLLASCVGLSVASVLYLRWAPPLLTPFMVGDKLKVLRAGQSVDIEYRWVPWERIAPVMALAVVAAEDQKFPRHRGFDVPSLRRAVAEGQRGGRLRGASTISQQLAKNLFLWSGRSWVRKALEAYFTVLLEAVLPKRRILELYLNVVELGPGVYGVEAAALRFFAKPAAQLTLREAARLAAVLPNPRRMRVDRPSHYVLSRASRIERQMAQLGPGYLRGI